jgi:hypothetical protein
MNKVLQGILLGTAVGVCTGIGGFILASTPKTAGMGGVMFYLVPVCAGFAIALVNDRGDAIAAAMLLAVLCSLLLLVAMRREGVLCAVLAFPLLAFGLALGAVLGFLARLLLRRFLSHRGSTAGVLVLIPLAIAGGHQMERKSLEIPRREIVSNSIHLSAAPDQVWGRIQAIDSIRAPKPFLMYIGLPIPVRCTLDKPRLGAKRTCYFENGFIQETITEWTPQRTMGLTIDRTNMPGRHWLGFENASYQLVPEANGTLLTRTTTITSHLYPVWYWRYFERMGVASEHEYLLRDLAAQR